MAGGVRLMPGDPTNTGPPSSAPALGRRLAATGPLYATVESARSPVPHLFHALPVTEDKPGDVRPRASATLPAVIELDLGWM